MSVVLIVEDDLFIRELAELIFREWGHQTLLASDVDEGLSHIRSPERIDALFTDIYLKKAVHGGCDLASQAIKLRPGLRVLYTTGNFVSPETNALFIAGSHCLRKPYTERQLQASVESMLAS